MAVHCTNKLHDSYLLFSVTVCVLFENFSSASVLTSDISEHEEFRHLRSISEPTAPPPRVRLHPGVVASVIIVALAAVVAAVFIIRKYCFPQRKGQCGCRFSYQPSRSLTDAAYRYSVLRQMEEQREEESDEDLLE